MEKYPNTHSREQLPTPTGLTKIKAFKSNFLALPIENVSDVLCCEWCEIVDEMFISDNL